MVFMQEKANNFVNVGSDNYNWLSFGTTVVLAATGGFILHGWRGGAGGLILSLTDKYLISNGLTAKHYLSTTGFWSATTLTHVASYLTKFLPSYSLYIQTTSYALSGAAAYFSDDFLNFQNKTEIPLASFFAVNNLFDKKGVISTQEITRIYDAFFESPYKALEMARDDINEIYNNNFLSSYAYSSGLSLVNIIIDNLFLSYLAGYVGNTFVTTLINNHRELLRDSQVTEVVSLATLKPFQPFIVEGTKIIGLFAVAKALQYFIYTKQNALFKSQFEMLVEKSTEIILDKDNSKKILTDEQGKEIVQNLAQDLVTLQFSGAKKLNDLISSSFKLLISLYNLMSYSPSAFSAYALTSIPVQKFIMSIAEQTKNITELESKTETKVWTVFSDIVKNIAEINLRDGGEFVKYQYNSLLMTKNSLSKESEYLSQQTDWVNKALELWNNFVDILFYGTMVLRKLDILNQIPIIKQSVDDLYSFLLSGPQFNIDNKGLILSKKRVDKLFEIIAVKEVNSVVRTTNKDGKVIFDNYTLKLDSKELVAIDHLEFDLGKHYAVTGKSGCGKTSTLIDLKQGIAKPLSSSGEISIAQHNDTAPKIMFIDQKLYLPHDTTLLESVCFPKTLTLISDQERAELRKKVVSLFKELEIDEFVNNPELYESSLASKLESTEFKLSGGQEKKIAIIQVILNNPDILIMDETFTGLDKKSLIKVQQVIEKYMPNILILSVDHHAEDNNYNDFYDLEVNFANGVVTQKPIVSKYIETYISEQEAVDKQSLNDICLHTNPFDDWNICYT